MNKKQSDEYRKGYMDGINEFRNRVINTLIGINSPKQLFYTIYSPQDVQVYKQPDPNSDLSKGYKAGITTAIDVIRKSP